MLLESCLMYRLAMAYAVILVSLNRTGLREVSERWMILVRVGSGVDGASRRDLGETVLDYAAPIRPLVLR
jgi:hypothetical protein